jgi:hypothetical protein
MGVVRNSNRIEIDEEETVTFDDTDYGDIDTAGKWRTTRDLTETLIPIHWVLCNQDSWCNLQSVDNGRAKTLRQQHVKPWFQ